MAAPAPFHELHTARALSSNNTAAGGYGDMVRATKFKHTVPTALFLVFVSSVLKAETKLERNHGVRYTINVKYTSVSKYGNRTMTTFDQ